MSTFARATALSLVALALPQAASADSIQKIKPIATGGKTLEVAGLATGSSGRPAALLVDRRTGAVTLWRGNEGAATVSRQKIATIEFGIRPNVLRAAGKTGLLTYWREYRGERERMIVASGDRLQTRQRFDGYDVVDIAAAPDGRAALLLRKGKAYGTEVREFAVATRGPGGRAFGAPVAIGKARSGQVAVGRTADTVTAALVSASGVTVAERATVDRSFTRAAIADDAHASNVALGVGDSGRITVAWTRSIVGGRQLVAATRRAAGAAFDAPAAVPVKAAALDQAPTVYVDGKRDGIVWAGDFGAAGIWPVVSSRGSGAWKSYFRTDSSAAGREGVAASEPFDNAFGIAATTSKSGRVKTANVGSGGSSRFRTVNGSRDTRTLPRVAAGGSKPWIAVTETRGKRTTIRIF
ncbi:MAG: hypothetical protein V9E83_12265 [Baekduia sp.]